MMLYFPGAQGSKGLHPSTDAVALSRGGPRRPGPPRPTPPAERMQATFTGSALEREFAGGSHKFSSTVDPASPVHRDMAGSRGGERHQRPGTGGPSPYGVLVPRRQPSPSVKHISSHRGVQRPSQQQQQQQQQHYSQQQQRPRHPGPRTRFPQNFPTHEQHPRPQQQPRHRGPPADWGLQPSAAGHGVAGSSLAGSYAAREQPAAHAASFGVERSAGCGGVGGRAGSYTACGGAEVYTLPSHDTDGHEAEMAAAMAELQQLQGVAQSDARDRWRFEQASRRPGTAPDGDSRVCNGHACGVATGTSSGDHHQAHASASGGGSSGMPSSSSPSLARPSTSAGQGETEAELRVRLATAESVMRKLYRKTNDLQERLSTGAPPPTAPASGEGSEWEGLRPSTAGADGADAGGGGELGASSSEREQALYLLQQKEADLQQMRDYTSQLASRVEHLAAEQQKSSAARPATAGGDARSDEYRERYMRMRGEYRQLLRSRTDSVRRAGRIAQDTEHGVLIEQLDNALKEEADLHRQESQRLNEQLYLKDKDSCDWYVEKRLLQDRLQAMEAEMSQRDELEGAIDSKMLALFSRLKALEDANIQLEQNNEELRQKAGLAEEGGAEAAQPQ